MWFFKLIESFFKRERGEQGSGLMTVLGVSLVVTIAAGTITSSIVMASNFTSEKLSQQQADAAAEAGIADAVHSYQTGNCVASSPMHDSPKYKYNFYRSNSENYPTTSSSSGTYVGCPGEEASGGTGSKADRWVMIESTGYGKNNTSKKKTAVFKVTPKHMNVIPQAITGNIVGIHKTQVNKDNGIMGKPSIFSSQSFSCYFGSNINANVKYQNTDNKIISSLWENPDDCIINGNFDIRIDNSSVNSLDLNKLTVNGNTCANKTTLGGNVKGKKYNKASITDCQYNGTHYGYVPDMSNLPPANIFSGTKCTNPSTFSSAIEGVSGENAIIDLTGCDKSSLESITNSTSIKNLNIKSNITLVFKERFMLNKINISSSDSKYHTLNFVVPSSEANPDTAKCSSATYNSKVASEATEVNYTDGTAGNIYTSCSLDVTDSNIIGQIYSGNSDSNSSLSISPSTIESEKSKFKYMPVGLPDAEKKIKDIGRVPDLIRVY